MQQKNNLIESAIFYHNQMHIDRSNASFLQILPLLQEETMTQFPAFPEVFGQLIPIYTPDCETVFETDGLHLYIRPDLLKQYFLEDFSYLHRCYLHIHLHCLCMHMIRNVACSKKNWDFACDLSVSLLEELLLNRQTLFNQCVQILRTYCGATLQNSSSTDLLSDLIKLLQNRKWLDAGQILRLFDLIPELITLAENCRLDSHKCWFHNTFLLSDELHDTSACHNGSHPSLTNRSVSESELNTLETLQKKWEKRLPELTLFSGKNQRGRSRGTITEAAGLQQHDSIDYRKFLRRFAVLREEPILDMDSFDYIPYYYGLTQYPVRMPFIEPLEYSEVYRLDELAIAIDTSGSCSGTIVRRFLEETWSILRQRENFFSKMRLHLIQCDLMIQEHRIFTSVEEWEAYLPDLKIHGHGDTDFTPVFEHLNRLIAKREIHNLRGLLYFTDGDGIFPTSAPAYDTAFVFLNEQTEKHEIPSWAIRLNLHLPDLF